MTSPDVVRAMMAETEEERDRHLNREVLRYAVMKRITCERSGVVLDVDRAVLVTTTKAGRSSAYVLDGPAWDEVQATLLAKIAELGMEVEVIDGRTLGE